MTTVREIARQAKVSPSTVSRVLNNKGRIGEKTRLRILGVARALGYPLPEVNLQPQSEKSKGNIGVFFNKRLRSLVTNPFYGEVVTGIEETLQKSGYRVFLQSIDKEASNFLAELTTEGNYQGLLFIGSDVNHHLIMEALEQQIPMVLIDNEIPSLPINCVMADNELGVRNIVAYLCKLNHSRIGFIGGPQTHMSLSQRYKGYRLGLEEHGLPLNQKFVILCDDQNKHGPDLGYEGTGMLVELKEHPTVIIADNDMTALGILKALREKGIDVPGEISVVGFDNINLAAHTYPPLTTMHIPKEQMGSIAVKRLIELIQDKEPVPLKIILRNTLIERDSTKRLNTVYP